MNKDRILWLRQAWELNKISLSESFEIECQDAYLIRASTVSPIAQCNKRAREIALPLTMMLLGLQELVSGISTQGGDRDVRH